MSDQRRKADSPPIIESTTQRLRRVSATVERIEPPHPDEWVTGEYYFGDDASQSRRLADVAQADGAPQTVVRAEPIRPQGSTERVLRVVVATGILLCAVVFFWDALAHSLARLVDAKRWRAVKVTVTSNPKARVFVAAKPRGWTPVSLVEYCRGQSIRVRVQAEGYATWAWTGPCPPRGELRLDAQLNPSPPELEHRD